MSDQTRTVSPEELTYLKGWLNKTESLSDEITVKPVEAMIATLDRDDLGPKKGDRLPPLWHWLYFFSHQQQSLLGPDGHPKRGGFLPPVQLPRRMWAGGRLNWQPDNPILLGEELQRDSKILSITHKTGRTGDLLFVTLKHEMHNTRGLALSEEHDIVYRAAPMPTDTPPAPQVSESAATWQREVVPDDVFLFRYSALTFNGHRIHYDRKYVTQVEGYPGLIVHGPLIATLLVDLVRRHAHNQFIKAFQFKAIRPTFDLTPFRVNGTPSDDGKSVKVWSQDHDGFLTMSGQVDLS